jgi:hypothetical protein
VARAAAELMRTMAMGLAGARGRVVLAGLAAALAGASVSATPIPGSLGGTSTGSASLVDGNRKNGGAC